MNVTNDDLRQCWSKIEQARDETPEQDDKWTAAQLAFFAFFRRIACDQAAEFLDAQIQNCRKLFDPFK